MPKKIKKKEVKTEKKTDSTVDDIKEEVEDTGKDVDEIKEEIIDAGKDIDEIKEEVEDTGKDVDEIKEDVDDIKEEVVEITKKQNTILKKISSQLLPSEFNFNDVAQQIVGAIILSSPLAVTEEVWNLAKELDPARIMVIIGITLLFDILLIYYTAYRKEKEKKIINLIPARLFSMILISYLTATTILYVFGVIGIYITDLDWAIRLVIFVGLFANVGAGTADIIR
tara:strand:- start:625 stop:1302 length:678 start_codon:yes stop_codon:yes gene_type:complete